VIVVLYNGTYSERTAEMKTLVTEAGWTLQYEKDETTRWLFAATKSGVVITGSVAACSTEPATETCAQLSTRGGTVLLTLTTPKQPAK
jgi:hypothetical protein